jgi:quercetin dioxygenase-like cupin family protein
MRNCVSPCGESKLSRAPIQGEEAQMSENLEFGKPTRLAGIIEYAPGAVVSKTLLKKPTGTVTLFAFDEAQELSEHTAPFDAGVLVIDGEVELRIGTETVRAKSGEFLVMPANVPHALRAVTKLKFVLTMIRS